MLDASLGTAIVSPSATWSKDGLEPLKIPAGTVGIGVKATR